jgi:hypothetical protein
VRLGEAERGFVAAEALALAERLSDREARAAYRRLARLAEAGEVPEEDAGAVEAVVAMALETGRARAVHGPAGVRALASVWRETPAGRRVARELEELNEALAVLRGLPVHVVRLAAAGPGAYSVSIAAGDYEVRLAVDRDGARLRSLNVGGGGIGE